MTDPQPSPKQRRLDQIRNRLSQASTDWTITADAEATHLSTGKGAGQLIGIIPHTANMDDRELALHAPDDLRWTVQLYLDLAARYRAEKQNGNRQRPPEIKSPPSIAAQCARICGKPAFKKFLEERHGLERPLTDERVATRVRFLLEIPSRKQLDTDPAAAARWHRLRDKYDAWRLM